MVKLTRRTHDGIVQIMSENISNGKPLKIFHMKTLCELFSDFDFGDDAAKEEDPNVSVQSSY